MHTRGQQVPELWGTVAVTLTRDVQNASVELLLTTPTAWCLGTSRGFLDLRGNVELTTTTLNVSKAETDPTGICPLPYTTTAVAIIVSDASGQRLVTESFPITYHFVAP